MKPITFPMADDSEDDRLSAREALNESRVLNDLRELEDGEEWIRSRHRRGDLADPVGSSLFRRRLRTWNDCHGH